MRYASFQVSSIITTTGFVTADFNMWPRIQSSYTYYSNVYRGNAGSTAGGIKCIRIVLLFKIIKQKITNINHPKAVQAVKINGRIVSEDILYGVLAYFFIIMSITAAAILIIALEGKDLVTTSTAVFTCINNVGPGGWSWIGR